MEHLRAQAPGVTSGLKGNMQKSIPEARQKIGYEYLVFQAVIDYLPASQIKQIADDYKECIACDLWTGTVSPNLEIQNILIFLDFLDSHIVPDKISSMEREFYRRTAERMVREGFLPQNVMEQFKKSKSVRTPHDIGKDKLILSLAA